MAATARVTGPVESHRGLGPRDHLCWGHDQPADCLPPLTESVAGGLERGLRLSGRPRAVR